MYLKDKTNLVSDNLRVLHFAPESALQAIFKSMANLEYVSVDLCSPLAMFKMDITNVACKENTFDVILCNHVLEHIKDDKDAIRELYRVLKPGGWTILQSPVDLELETTFEDPDIVTPEEREITFGQSDHVRIYGRDYKDRIENAGFIVIVDSYVRGLGNETIKRCGLMGDEDIYFCIKPIFRKA